MSERRRLRMPLRPALPLEERGRGDAARVLPLGGVASLAVSPDVVRAKLGAWVGLLPVEERPDLDATSREVVLLLGALVEAGTAALGADALPPWERGVPVPREPLDLQQRAALSRDAVRRATDRAISAELLDLERRVGDELVVRLRPDVFADAPVVAAVDWGTVRRALGTQVSPVALLLVREIARRTTPERRAQGEVVPISLREFGAATGASKGTIQKALAALNATALVESRTRDRVDSWHRLLPPAFGVLPAPVRTPEPADAGSVGDTPVAAASATALPSGSGGRASPARDASSAPLERPRVDASVHDRRVPSAPALTSRPAHRPPPLATGDAVTVYEVSGIAWPLPAGVQPRLERGADGVPMRRIGNVRIPLRGPAETAALPVVEIDGVRWELLPDARPQLEREPDGSFWYRIDAERWPFRPQ
ncbi:hypothetical protein [Roseisolibacter agri]|uniref:Uncharacterized protein n=1 Tax=Roseisolibacter agri TaxID=2014610 RepID=A0AA37QED0_9BACT|nr:hypothetical protein [Roseisolibacter agri]GLC28261.1 hypothetical protein rosag_47740 [Roseisolibacter agri]